MDIQSTQNKRFLAGGIQMFMQNVNLFQAVKMWISLGIE